MFVDKLFACVADCVCMYVGICVYNAQSESCANVNVYIAHCKCLHCVNVYISTMFTRNAATFRAFDCCERLCAAIIPQHRTLPKPQG